MSDASSSAATRAGGSPRWRVATSVFVAVIVLFFASQTVSGLILGLYASTQHWTSAQIQTWLSDSTAAQFAFGAIAEISLVAGVWVVLRWLGWHWPDIAMRKPKPIHLLWGLLAFVPYFLFYLALVLGLSALFPGFNVNQRQDIGFNSLHGPVDLALAFIGLVIIPPLAEEITMRGLLYTGLKKWLPTIVAALIVSVMFGAAHLAEGGDSGPLWIGAVDTFSLSMVLVFLREQTGSLWAGIVLHAAKNLVAFASLFLIK